jgi:ABC-type Na+ efflux pump permease subunit
MYSPPPFNERSEGQKVIIGAVIPALIGGLAGFLVGVSAAAYWAVGLLAAVGAFLGGFEHSDGWDAADRGFFGGVIYGTSLLLVHEIIHDKAKVSLGSFPPFLVVVTALAGTLLSAAGGRVARTQRRRRRAAAATPTAPGPTAGPTPGV